MQSRFVEADAREMAERYGARGIAEDIALRVYTTRLLGSDPKLVLHDSGNIAAALR